MSSATTYCQVCELSRAEHDRAEVVGGVNHQFSRDGEIRRLEKVPTQPAGPRMVIANAVDMELRAVLLRKGVIDASDFGAVHDAGPGTS